MSMPEHSKQRLISFCYCSPNMVMDKCDYCSAKFEIGRLLDTAAEIPELKSSEFLEEELDEIAKYYNITPKGRLNLTLELEEEEFKRWSQGY